METKHETRGKNDVHIETSGMEINLQIQNTLNENDLNL